LPFVVLLLLAIVQVGLVVRDEILVVHAAREAARAAAVDPDEAAARRAAVGSSGLEKGRMDVSITGRGRAGSTLSATVRYSAPTEVPLIGQLLPDVRLRAVASMRVEV
jgi:Flp pilus assembly protein TadG